MSAKPLLAVLRETRALLARPGNEFLWSTWEDAEAALGEVDALLRVLEMGALPPAVAVTVLFAPTGDVQETAISSGWGDEFLALAKRCDAAVHLAYGHPTPPPRPPDPPEPPRQEWTALFAAVRRLLAAVRPAPPPGWSGDERPLAVCREELGALPLFGNRVHLWALRPDGTVLCMDHEAFSRPVHEETHPVVRYAVLRCGARRYPELRDLVPPQPPGARRCGACDGSGVLEAGGGSCLHCTAGWIRTGF